jgi:hypothetical protein
MRTSLFFTSATLLAGLANALPLQSRQANTIQISIKTGDGDASVQISVTLDQLFTTPQQAVAASIFDPTAVCQAFSDSAATKPLGAPFNAANGVTFVNDGSVASVASDAITVGAFLCSSSSSKLLADETKTMTSGSSSTSSSSSSSSSSTSSSSTATVTIELEQSADQFVQGTVPANGSIFLTAGTNFGTLGLDFNIVAAQGANVNNVKCQAFYDTSATIIAGTFATEANGGDVLTTDRNNPVTVNAFICTVSA